VQQGVERYQAGKFTEAIALWQQVLPQIRDAKDRAAVYSNLALAYRQIGQLGEAIAQWEQAIQIYQHHGSEVARIQLPKLLTEQAQAYSAYWKNSVTYHRDAMEFFQYRARVPQLTQQESTRWGEGV